MSYLLDEPDFINCYSSIEGIVTDYSCTRHDDFALDLPTDQFQLTYDISYPSCIPDENALGQYEISGPESDRGVNLFTYPSAPSAGNQIDTQLLSTSFSQQLFSSDGLSCFWQPPVPHASSAHEDATLIGVGESLIPHSFDSLTLPENLATLTPNTRSLNNCTGVFRPRSTHPRLLRHAPYSIGPESTRRSASAVSFHLCQWSDRGKPCGQAVVGTKDAITEHLQTVHAIRLKADKTSQACHWEKCRKSVKRESIARHILTVHMRDKVPCPGCGSHFARMDSMQRHHRTQCIARGEMFDACRTEK